MEHKGRFLDEIADTVWAICEESAWQLPAHNSYVRDTPQLPLPDTTRPIVDLFAAETGALLALTRYLLPDELDTAAPGITARMERELDARILTPYFTSHFWWMGNGEEPMCNWTSWCTQNVLLTVFLLPTTQQQRKAAVKQAALKFYPTLRRRPSARYSEKQRSKISRSTSAMSMWKDLTI